MDSDVDSSYDSEEERQNAMRSRIGAPPSFKQSVVLPAKAWFRQLKHQYLLTFAKRKDANCATDEGSESHTNVYDLASSTRRKFERGLVDDDDGFKYTREQKRARRKRQEERIERAKRERLRKLSLHKSMTNSSISDKTNNTHFETSDSNKSDIVSSANDNLHFYRKNEEELKIDENDDNSIDKDLHRIQLTVPNSPPKTTSNIHRTNLPKKEFQMKKCSQNENSNSPKDSTPNDNGISHPFLDPNFGSDSNIKEYTFTKEDYEILNNPSFHKSLRVFDRLLSPFTTLYRISVGFVFLITFLYPHLSFTLVLVILCTLLPMDYDMSHEIVVATQGVIGFLLGFILTVRLQSAYDILQESRRSIIAIVTQLKAFSIELHHATERSQTLNKGKYEKISEEDSFLSLTTNFKTLNGTEGENEEEQKLLRFLKRLDRRLMRADDMVEERVELFLSLLRVKLNLLFLAIRQSLRESVLGFKPHGVLGYLRYNRKTWIFDPIEPKAINLLHESNILYERIGAHGTFFNESRDSILNTALLTSKKFLESKQNLKSQDTTDKDSSSSEKYNIDRKIRSNENSGKDETQATFNVLQDRINKIKAIKIIPPHALHKAKGLTPSAYYSTFDSSTRALVISSELRKMINDIDDLLALSSIGLYSSEEQSNDKVNRSMDEIVSNIDNQFLKDRLHQCLNDVMREYDIARGIRDTEMPYPYTFIVEVMIFLFVYSTPFLFPSYEFFRNSENEAKEKELTEGIKELQWQFDFFKIMYMLLPFILTFAYYGVNSICNQLEKPYSWGQFRIALGGYGMEVFNLTEHLMRVHGRQYTGNSKLLKRYNNIKILNNENKMDSRKYRLRNQQSAYVQNKNIMLRYDQ